MVMLWQIRVLLTEFTGDQGCLVLDNNNLLAVSIDFHSDLKQQSLRSGVAVAVAFNFAVIFCLKKGKSNQLVNAFTAKNTRVQNKELIREIFNSTMWSYTRVLCSESQKHLEQHNKPHESTAQQFSFKWSHIRISSTDSKVRTTLYSIIISSF